MPPVRYPVAEWRGDGQSGGTWASTAYRVVLHTTETRTLPGYQKGATAPHFTYSPASRRWWQHTNLDRAARALRNEPGGVETNRLGSLQIEIICYSSQPTADRVGGLWVGALPDTAYDDLAGFCRWAAEHFHVEAKWPGRTALSYGEANQAGFRMTPAQWVGFRGVCAHQHVPENHHWDTGALDIARIVALMQQEDDMDLDAVRALVRAEVTDSIPAIAEAVWKYRGRFAVPPDTTATAGTTLEAVEKIVRRIDAKVRAAGPYNFGAVADGHVEG